MEMLRTLFQICQNRILISVVALCQQLDRFCTVQDRLAPLPLSVLMELGGFAGGEKQNSGFRTVKAFRYRIITQLRPVR